MATQKKRNFDVLVFGGTGFMGNYAIECIAAKAAQNSHLANVQIFTVNRGIASGRADRWDIAERIRPHVTHNFICDRDDGTSSLMNCKELLNYNLGNVRMVIDFSTYRAEQMRDSLEFVKSKLKAPFYFYISSEACFEVSRRPAPTTPWPVLREEDAIRPESEAERKRLACWQYAEDKMAAEEVFLAEHGDIPYLSLRPPDVIGPRDTWEVLWWQFQTLIHLAACTNNLVKPIRLPSWLRTKPSSYVYGPDVGRVVGDAFDGLLQKDISQLPFVNKVYNFAYPDPITPPQLLEAIVESISGVASKKSSDSLVEFVKSGDEQEGFYVDMYRFMEAHPELNYGMQIVYPGVTSVSGVSVEKFMNDFPLFKFTPFKESIRETFAFFNEAIHSEKYRNRFVAMVKQLARELVYEKLMEDSEKSLEIYWSEVNKLFGLNIKP